MVDSRRYIFAVFVAQLALFSLFINSRNLNLFLEARTMSVTKDVENPKMLVAKVGLVHPKPKNYDPPKLVWLLSFPNR